MIQSKEESAAQSAPPSDSLATSASDWCYPVIKEGRLRVPPRLPDRSAPTRARLHEQLKRPCGSGSVQFCVVPFNVITTFAVAEPSYVITSLRAVVVGD